MKSSNRKREKDHPEAVRKGWTMLLFDTPDNSGKDSDTINSFFFELTFTQFLREIRADVNSFFGFLDGFPRDSVENAETYRRMWECLKKDKEYREHGRRVVFVRGTAVVKERS